MTDPVLTAQVNGLRELGEALKEFGDQIAKRYLRRATFAAAAVFKGAAEEKAPVRTGAMRDAIAVFRRRPPSPDAALYVVGVRKIKYSRAEKRALRILRKANKTVRVIGDAYYWRFVELGTVKMKARPFMRPAFELKKGEALAAFKESLADGVEKAKRSAARLARKAT